MSEPSGFYKRRNRQGQMTTRPVIAPSGYSPYRESPLEIFRQVSKKMQGQKTFSEAEVLNAIDEYSTVEATDNKLAPVSLGDISFELVARGELQREVEESVVREIPEIKKVVERLIAKGYVERLEGAFLPTATGRDWLNKFPVVSAQQRRLLQYIIERKPVLQEINDQDYPILEKLETRHYVEVKTKEKDIPIVITDKGLKELAKVESTQIATEPEL